MNFIAEQLSNAGIQLAGEMTKMGISHEVLTNLSKIRLSGGAGEDGFNVLHVVEGAAAGFVLSLFLLGIQRSPKNEATELVIEATVAGGFMGSLLELVRINQ